MAAIGDRKSAEWFKHIEPGNLGTVKPNMEMKIVDLETGRALPPGERGEICFRGECCFVGYLNNPKATKETLDSNGWYHSGDMGYCSADGDLFFVDRQKEMLKYKMYTIIPAEIEDFLSSHEAVGGVCVVGVPHQMDGIWIRAYVELLPGKKLTEHELIEEVKQNMGSKNQLKAGVRFVNNMARTLIGKIDRNYFKQLVREELITDCEV